MVNITIDGNTYEVSDNITVLQAAREAGVEIPTLCDHPELTPYGGCRLCLVEVEGARTLQPSCTLPVTPNMVVKTNTDKVKSARKFVLTLIFSERNHFCPFCQVSGGDCELQNAAYAEGMTHWPLVPNWQPFEVDASNPFFVIDNNRCILCRRCVRACGELVGNFTLGFEQRGARSFLVADLGAPIGESSCVSCGACVQVCPTGAIIDRQSAYRGKVIEVQHNQTVCVGCSVGCGLDVLTRDNNLVRIEGNWEAEVNGGVLCKVGRFLPLEERRERIVTPLVRKDGRLKAATWDEALETIAARLQPLAGRNGDGAAALASTRLSAEALFAFKNLFADGLKSQMVTSIEEGSATAASTRLANELGRPFEGNLDDIDSADCVVLASADLAEDHQVAGFFVKRILPQGTELVIVSSDENDFEKYASSVLKVRKGAETDAVAGITAAVAGNEAGVQAAAAKTGIAAETFAEAGRKIKSAEKTVVLYDQAVDARAALELAEAAGGSALSPKGKANSMVAAQYQMEDAFKVGDHQAVYIALGDDEPSQRMLLAATKSPFLAVQATYVSQLTAAADVVLPVANWLEQEGHYVNLEGRVQTAKAAMVAPEGVWTNEAVLTALAGKLGLSAGTDTWQEALNRCAPAVAII